MDRARHQLLAGPGLPENANARLAGGHTIDFAQQFLHRCAVAYQLMLAQPVAQLLIFRFEPRQAQRIFDGQQQLVSGQRFFEKIQRAQFGGPHCYLDIGLPGNHDDGSFYSRALQFFEKLESRFPWHDHI